MKQCISTAFFHTSGKSPNLGSTSEKEKLAVYYRCIVVFFLSAKKQYPKADLVLFTNSIPIDEYKAIFDEINLTIEVLNHNEITYANGSISNSFPGCLFTLDVITYCAKKNWDTSYTNLLIFDSDCIIRKPFKETSSNIKGIVIDYPKEHNVNGQTKISLTTISKEIWKTTSTIDYYGGEYYEIPLSKVNELSNDIDVVFKFLQNSIDTYGSQFTEEHILSIIFAKPHRNIENDKSTIKRIWTANTFNNVDESDNMISVYHLPAEKNRLFRELFTKVQSNGFTLSEDYSQELFDYVWKRKNPILPIRIINSIKRILKSKGFGK